MCAFQISVKCFRCGKEHQIEVSQNNGLYECNGCGEKLMKVDKVNKKNIMPKFDQCISQNMGEASKACYLNGSDMLEDANILYDNERYSRAFSLAILAEEELSKSVFLHILIDQKRWDSDVYATLLSHKHKHTFAQSLKELVFLIVDQMKLNSRLLVQYPINIDRPAHDIIEKNKKELLKKQKRDKRKQHAQFVGINKNAQVTSTPNEIDILETAVIIDDVLRFKILVGCMFGYFTGDHPLLRTSSSIQYQNHITTLFHESGINIIMDIFDLDMEKYGNDKQMLNPYKTLSDLQTLSFDTLCNNEEKEIAARLCKAYGFSSQIKKEMIRLGLRSPLFLNECVELENTSSACMSCTSSER